MMSLFFIDDILSDDTTTRGACVSAGVVKLLPTATSWLAERSDPVVAAEVGSRLKKKYKTGLLMCCDYATGYVSCFQL